LELVKGPDKTPIRVNSSQADEALLEEWINTYQTALLRLCYLQLHDVSLAEDAVQETFWKAYRAMEGFRGEANPKTWLARIAINTCRDMLRTSWFKRVDRRVDPNTLPPAIIQPTETESELSLAIMNLPRKLRETILLYYYHDMSTVEIASVLGIAQPTVSSRLKRGREKLRTLLERREDP